MSRLVGFHAGPIADEGGTGVMGPIPTTAAQRRSVVVFRLAHLYFIVCPETCALKTAAPHLGSSRFIGHGPTHCEWKPASADRDRPRHAHVAVAHPAFLPHVAGQIGKGARRHQYEPALAIPAGKDLDLGNLLIDLGGCLPSHSTSTLRVNISPLQVPAGNTLKKTG